MSELSLADNFNQYFDIRFATSKALRHLSYRIRHDVYAQELGWEETNERGMETDECDPYAFPLLLRHKPSNQFAGTIRLIIPPTYNTRLPLPFEQHCQQFIDKEVIDTEQLPRGTFGEVSRLAVPASFRRRAGEQGKPYVIEEATDYEFNDADRRVFPNIAVGLYLSVLALLAMCNHSHAFVVTEPKLFRRLARLGFDFTPCTPLLDYHGKRTLYVSPTQVAIGGLAQEVKTLYDGLYQQIADQVHYYPYLPISELD